MNFLTSVISTALDTTYRVVKVLRMGKDDVQEAAECAPFGVDANPIKDMIAVYAETIDKGDSVIIGYLNANQLAAPGEVRMYSTDADGAMKTYTWLKADGTMEIGGSANHMVQYEALATAFNKLKSDHDALIDEWVSFCAVYAPGPSVVPIPTSAAHSTADISPAKLDKIKTS